jgi:hypothetical protein
MKKFVLQLGILFTATMSFAASPVTTRTVYDATLRNGFSIHHIRHEAIGDMTRLFTDDSSYIDVPTAEIADMAESQEAIVPESRLHQ